MNSCVVRRRQTEVAVMSAVVGSGLPAISLPEQLCATSQTAGSKTGRLC